jgi:hypothetical protein
MVNNYLRSIAKINDIEFKMLRKNDNCWIKIEPIKRESIPSSLHIILNGEDYHLDIYDRSGKESHKIYFKGCKSMPCFYLKSGENCYRIDCTDDKIHVNPITETHSMENYLKNNCNCISSESTCWATAIYYTSRPEKPPFNEM